MGIVLIRTGNRFASTVLWYLIGTPLVTAKATVCNDDILTILIHIMYHAEKVSV